MTGGVTGGRAGATGGPAVIRVLVVEDEQLTAAAHAQYVARLEGFEVVATARTAHAALEAVARSRDAGRRVDLVLLDMHLPDRHGLDVARLIRGSGTDVDIMVISAANDVPTVRAAATTGIVGYLIKPFAFADFAAKMRGYRTYRRALSAGRPGAVAQDEVDRALAALHDDAPAGLPKGLAPETLDQITALLRDGDRAFSASEVGERLGLSRVTARRYLEHLARVDRVTRTPRHGQAGRPELEYRWSG
ncbi:response regulator [Georgenia sp. SYP-B2076]|uniref:response regulator n=1 Tax=Georgenia sp. SYP-B2076 TaxID=2495881 RepID=UPI001F0C28C1|nr:response regulator [Georgenia sp. SYP-B2076]